MVRCSFSLLYTLTFLDQKDVKTSLEHGADYGDGPQGYITTPPPHVNTPEPYRYEKPKPYTLSTTTTTKTTTTTTSTTTPVTHERPNQYTYEKPKPFEQPSTIRTTASTITSHISCIWEQWTAWSGLSGCHKQSVSRTRECKCSDGLTNNDKCDGVANEQKQEPDTCESCAWEQWSSWSERDSCKKQITTRRRFCECSYESQSSGDKCGGGSSEQGRRLPNIC